jgi:hypothetical protein
MVESHDNSPLLVRIGLESVIAIISATSVAPIISIVDKAIVSNASGLEPLVPCILNGFKTLFTKPFYFIKQPSFLMILGVYSGTYIVGNCTDAACDRAKRSSFYPKFVTSSVANVTLSVLKDKQFAKMFSKGVIEKPLPKLSYFLFATRDSATIFASFSLPKPTSQFIQRHFDISPFIADSSVQLFTPIAMQILSTPLHLYGLDIYNREVVSNFQERIEFIKREYAKTVLARMSRILPAYGFGGIINSHLRKSGKEYLAATY